VFTRFNQWLLPINPASYKNVSKKIRARVGAGK